MSDKYNLCADDNATFLILSFVSGITNRYALFLDEESDPLDILKQSDKDKLVAKTKKIEAATKPAAKAAPKSNTKNEAGKIISEYYCYE